MAKAGSASAPRRSEHELLLSCARTRGAEAQAERARQLVRGGIDWAALLTLALDHGVMPLLYRNLFILGPEAAPAPFVDNLRALAMANTYRNLSLTAELLRVISVLEDNGVPAVAYKGPVLAAIAYGDTALRQFSDLDLLVGRQDLEKVKAILLSAGFLLSHSLTKKQERAHLAHTCEVGFGLEDPRVHLDVHWRFAARFMGLGPDAGAALAGRRRVPVGGRSVPSLDREDMLLVLCLNGAFHTWWKLAQICDIAELIEANEGWDWPGLLARARARGMLRMLLLGVSLAAELVSAPVPRAVTSLAGCDPAVTALRDDVKRTLLAGKVVWPSLAGEIRFQVRTLDTRRDRLRYLWIRSVVPTVHDWQWVHLPDTFYVLYYLLRPVRLAVQGLGMPIIRRLGLRRGILS
jgi:hypothetical protein